MEIFIIILIIAIIIIVISIRSFLNHKRKSDYALSALTVKYIYHNLSEEKKAKIDYEANNIIYEQYLKGTSLIENIDDYDEVIKFAEKMLEKRKRVNQWGYWLFLAYVFVKLQFPNPFGYNWYIAKFPFKELVGEEKYAIRGMQEFLQDKHQIEVK